MLFIRIDLLAHPFASLSYLLVGITWMCVSYLLVVFIYNLFYHPLSQYPGPLSARISALRALLHAYRGDTHLDILKCHEKYGPIVRYAPNRVVYNTAQALRDVYGKGKNTQKLSSYVRSGEVPSVSNGGNGVNEEDHGQRRRIVAQSFTPAALGSFEAIILAHTLQFCRTLHQSTQSGWPLDNAEVWSSPQDMDSLAKYLAMDIITDLVYGQALDLVNTPDHRWLVDAVTNAGRIDLRSLDYLGGHDSNSSSGLNPWMWIFRGADDQQKMSRLLDEQLKQRREAAKGEAIERIDLTSTLCGNRDPKTGSRLSEDETWREIQMMVIAGSNTVGMAIASTLHSLALKSSAYDQLTEEIRSIFPSLESIHQGTQLTSCAYLRSCIDEAMRINPPKPELSWREVSSGGATINGAHVPEGCEVAVCLYAVHHNAEYFPDPHTFNPDRFMPKCPQTEPTLNKPKFDFFPTSRANTMFPSSPSAVSPNSFQGMYFPCTTNSRDNPAFAPFLLGSGGCVGKPLAYLEISLALAKLVWCFDFKMADDSQGDAIDGVKRCMLQFRRREGIDLE